MTAIKPKTRFEPQLCILQGNSWVYHYPVLSNDGTCELLTYFQLDSIYPPNYNEEEMDMINAWIKSDTWLNSQEYVFYSNGYRHYD